MTDICARRFVIKITGKREILMSLNLYHMASLLFGKKRHVIKAAPYIVHSAVNIFFSPLSLAEIF